MDPPAPRSGSSVPPAPSPTRRARATLLGGVRSLFRPDGLPPEAAAELEAVLGSVGREAVAGGPGRLGRIRTQVRAAPPRLLDWMSGQVVDHPAVLYDVEGVEVLAARQTRSIAAAMGALQLALVGAAAASTLEGGPVLALAIDGAVGQVAAVVHGSCDWYNTGSFLVRRLHATGIVAGPTEVRRLTNAALVSRGRTIDERALARASELRVIRGWVGRGLADALPFGSRLGSASSRAAERIERSDLVRLIDLVRSDRSALGDVGPS